MFYEASRLARALPGGAEYDLVVCDLLLRCSLSLIDGLALYGSNSGPSSSAPFHNTSLKDLIFDTLLELGGRLRQGTLQPGSCARHEEDWFEAELVAFVALSGKEAPDDGFLAATRAFIGVKCAILAARVVWSAIFSKIFTPSDLLACLGSMIDLLEMISEAPPRSVILTGEVELYNDLDRFFTDPETEKVRQSLPEDLSRRLQHASTQWHRYIEQQPAAIREIYAARTQHVIANSAQSTARATHRMERQPRTCALASCAAVDSPGKPHRSCAACMNAFYCSREHQREDWPSHKTACKQARKASGAS